MCRRRGVGFVSPHIAHSRFIPFFETASAAFVAAYAAGRQQRKRLDGVVESPTILEIVLPVRVAFQYKVRMDAFASVVVG